MLIALHVGQLVGNRIRNACLHDQVQQTNAVKWRNLAWLAGFDIGVDQVPHVSLERLEVQGFAAGLADDLADGKVLIQLGLDGLGVLFAVPGCSHFIGHIAIRAQQRHHTLVESHALRFVGLEVVGNLGITAEVVNVLQLTLGRLYWLAQQEQCFQRSIQPFPAQRQPVLQHHFGVGAACTVVDFRGVNRNGFFHLFEQILVIDDVAKVLVIAVQSVGAADCLEQTMVLHGLVDV